MVWNSLPTEFCDLSIGLNLFLGSLLRRYYSHDINASSTIDVCMILRYVNFRYTIYLKVGFMSQRSYGGSSVIV